MKKIIGIVVFIIAAGVAVLAFLNGEDFVDLFDFGDFFKKRFKNKKQS